MNSAKENKSPQTVEPNGKKGRETITLAHGSGGRAMSELIEGVVLKSFNNPELALLEDSARIDLKDLAELGDRLAFTTDSFVVDPLFFPGGNIGTLAINGTVNDLAMSGAVPLHLSCGLILEEGFPQDVLKKILASMQAEAEKTGVTIVTGDTKVVPRKAVDKIFINTTGIGVIPEGVSPASTQARPGDQVVVNGFLGDHGAAILEARGDLSLESSIKSDCQSLSGLVRAILKVCPHIHCMRDATRGGVATVLNELASGSSVGIKLDEKKIPVRDEVRGMCEILGLDPLYLANEGLMVAIVPSDKSDIVLQKMRSLPEGKDSTVIGEVIAVPQKRVVLKTLFGGERIVDMMVGEQLPRIC